MTDHDRTALSCGRIGFLPHFSSASQQTPGKCKEAESADNDKVIDTENTATALEGSEEVRTLLNICSAICVLSTLLRVRWVTHCEWLSTDEDATVQLVMHSRTDRGL
jgi:hypothetical protein